MNATEQAFSASINTMDPDQVNASLDSQKRWPIHKDKALCSYILSTVQAPEGSLSIQESIIPEAGSGLFTTRDLAEGDLIFTSVPLVLCAEVGEGMEACDFCFQQRRRVFHPVEDRFLQPGEVLPPLHVCNGCRLYQYCSPACSQRAWDTGHLYECGLMAGASTDVEIRTLYRLLILMQKKVLLAQQVKALARLEHELASLERRSKKTWPKILNIAREAKERTKSELSIGEILMLYGIVRCNSLPVDQTFRNAPLGNALDLGGALINHCCEPNVVIVFNRTQVQVRALRKLQAGEELFHCYRDMAYDFTFRSPRIAARYQFRCQCDRCRMESDRHHMQAKEADVIPLILTTQASLFDIIDEAKKEAFATPSTFDVALQLRKVNKILKTGYAGGPWPNKLEPLPTVLKALAALCEREGDLVSSVKIRVKALAYTELRKGLHWSEDLIDFVLCMSTFTMYPSHPELKDPALPKYKDFQDIFIGHLHALHGILTNLYGPQGRTTTIVHAFLQSEKATYNGPAPSTRGFRRRFKAAQENVLRWAGVDVGLWPVE
ncbi:SET domain-containing protein [Trichoderma chlorosporum]